MLITKIESNEWLLLGTDIRLKASHAVTLSVDAPREIPILRGELLLRSLTSLVNRASEFPAAELSGLALLCHGYGYQPLVMSLGFDFTKLSAREYRDACHKYRAQIAAWCNRAVGAFGERAKVAG